jgi:uncharacterized protein (TIGR00369 family)
MADLPPFDPERVRKSFAKQQVMATLGATLDRVEQGEVDISMPFSAEFTQQHGYLHAGIVATIADSACGYAAFSVMSEDSAVLSIEFKTNMLAPADGERFIARARVTKSGRTIIVCDATVHASRNGAEKLVATMTGTMMAIRGRGITD